MKPLVSIVLLLAIAGSLSAEATRHSIFKSTDRGRTWFQADKGLPGDARVNTFASMGGAVFAGTDAGIFVSRDEGRSWRRAPGRAPASARILSFAAHGEALDAGTAANGLLSSRDGGKTWLRNALFPAGRVNTVLR